ncbi:hypothetical protein ASF53_21030 [Methylobacterium sp. Leaf123]|uniref:hypothetical protein n=1 Tax=Methylobacterium sp. Leaf123 TaxID=1736264 RepID=UPI0006FFE222|nr:hypothetical protein [Methylobacterium sp. Leaf123]KQQ26419.1 hypothetical protein ASF53_21030 [Methylobacterium sp. Leaf123]
MQNRDPLWYDRAEPEEEPGLLLTTVAILFVGALDLYSLPYRLCQAFTGRFVRRVVRPAHRP